jgi:hypothetical protein
MADSAQVNNQDIVGLYDRINRFIEEMIKSVSSQGAFFNAFDQGRLEAYLNAIDFYHDWVIAQPQLDLPETAPRFYALETPPATPNVENECVNDIVRMFVTTRDELVHSQSARMGAQLLAFDSRRLRDITTKVRNFLTDYIKKTDPMDLPESSPKEVTSGSGKAGI